MDLSIVFIIQIVVIIVFSVLASIFDVKRNIVPDELNLSLLIFGLVSNLILSLLSDNVKYILASIISMVITYIVSYLLWRLKIWGGGDAKLFTSIATVVPFGININFLNIYPTLSFYPFSFSLMINSILASFPFILAFVIYRLSKNNLKKNTDLLVNIFNVGSLKVMMNLNLNKMVPIKDVREGMIVNNYYFDNEEIIDLINETEGNLKVYKSEDDDFKYYFKSQSAGGITEREMYLLKIMESQNLISKDVSVKLSYPFTPSILCGLMITIFCGDLMMLFAKNLFLVV